MELKEILELFEKEIFNHKTYTDYGNAFARTELSIRQWAIDKLPKEREISAEGKTQYYTHQDWFDCGFNEHGILAKKALGGTDERFNNTHSLKEQTG